MNYYGVIMAGGGGTRFWPLSRETNPKQFLNLSGNDAMVNEAIDRMATVIDRDYIFIVTSQIQADMMRTVTKGKIPAENIIEEPSARNTAACIGLSATILQKRFGDGAMLITPADHYIQNVAALSRSFATGIQTAEESDRIVTIGLKPTFPSTGFGYIRFEGHGNSLGKVMPVVEFKEKPDMKTAKEYVASGNYLWNSGMFMWKTSVVLKKIKQYAPDIHDILSQIGDAVGTSVETDTISRLYPEIRKISVTIQSPVKM